jgi:hypothetical protein
MDTYVSISKWMDEENVVYVHDGAIKKIKKSCHLWKRG